MDFIKNYIKYLQDNPKGYWFKRKLYGWGWVPVTWQGWLVIAISIGICYLGITIGEQDDSPGLMLLGFLLGVGLLFYFGYTKGEKPKWQWGKPRRK